MEMMRCVWDGDDVVCGMEMMWGGWDGSSCEDGDPREGRIIIVGMILFFLNALSTITTGCRLGEGRREGAISTQKSALGLPGPRTARDACPRTGEEGPGWRGRTRLAGMDQAVGRIRLWEGPRWLPP